MWWVLFAFLALALSLFLFAKIQPDIPDELAFLRGDGGTAIHQPAQPTERFAGPWTSFAEAPEWLVRRFSDGSAEFQLALDTPIEMTGQRYGEPFVEVTCARGYVFVGLYAGFPFRQSAQANETSVEVNGKASAWPLSRNGMTAYAPSAHRLASGENAGDVSFKVSLEEAGGYQGSANLSGLDKVVATARKACR